MHNNATYTLRVETQKIVADCRRFYIMSMVTALEHHRGTYEPVVNNEIN